MAEYKTPVSRKALKAQLKTAFITWLDEAIIDDDNKPDSGLYDNAYEAAGNVYDEEIEDDKTHAHAMAAAKERFWNQVQADLHDLLDEAFGDLGK